MSGESEKPSIFSTAYSYYPTVQAISGGTVAFSPQPPPSKTIFVAYPYRIDRDDYRRPFEEVQRAFGVRFEFADQEIASRHILQKIETMIERSRFCLFDITYWNANVTLELGIALGRRKVFYLLFNPNADGGTEHVPSDLAGFDRVTYRSYSQLTDGLTQVLLQEVGPPRPAGDQQVDLDSLRDQVLQLLGERPGLTMAQIATELDTQVPLAQLVIRPLVGELLETRGNRRWTKYYLADQAPLERPTPT